MYGPIVSGVVALSLVIGGMRVLKYYIVFFVLSMTVLYLGQDKIMYIPSIPTCFKFMGYAGLQQHPADNRKSMQHPSLHNLDTLNLTLVTQDGVTLRGWHIRYSHKEQPKARRVVVFFHENAGNIGLRIMMLFSMVQITRSDAIIVAYRGFSDSDGTPSESGVQKDSEAIMDYAVKYTQDNKMELFVMGKSLGGAVAIYAVTRPQFSSKVYGLVLQNTFTSISDIIDAKMPLLTLFKGFILSNHWRSIDLIPQVKAPILFIKSLNDEVVPIEQMQKLQSYANSSRLVQEYVVQQGSHNRDWEYDSQAFFQKMHQFFMSAKDLKK